MAADLAEKIVVDAPPAAVYGAVADVRRIARWSPECFAVLVWRRRGGVPARFVGFNRRGPFVWFTTCHVTVAEPAREFAFDVTVFGLPAARWGYTFAAAATGTDVTEYWFDRRGKIVKILGRIFTGTVSDTRPTVNREGMRTTLERLKRDLESP